MKKVLFIGSAVLLLAAFVFGALMYNAQRAEEATKAAQKNQAVLVRMHSPNLGPAEAKVHIVEFLDPACETCRAFYPYVKKFLADNPGKIRLTIRYAPFHTNSDQVVRMIEAARRQGKFWEALEALLATQPDWAPRHTPQPERALQALLPLKLDMERLRRDMNAPEIAAIVDQDLRDARTLNVSATPEFFVNGKGMPSFGYEQLKGLVDEALAANYR